MQFQCFQILDHETVDKEDSKILDAFQIEIKKYNDFFSHIFFQLFFFSDKTFTFNVWHLHFSNITIFFSKNLIAPTSTEGRFS